MDGQYALPHQNTEKVRTEMSLSVLAKNIKRMIRMMGVPALL